MRHLEILALKLVTHEQQRANDRMAIYFGLPVVVHVTVDLHVGDRRDHGTEDGPRVRSLTGQIKHWVRSWLRSLLVS